MTNHPNVRDYEKMLIRIPPGMKEKIALAAKKAGYSMNSAVIALLEVGMAKEAHREEMMKSADDLQQRLELIEKEVRAMKAEDGAKK